MATTSADSSPLRLAVVVGSTRPGRRARRVAEWVHGLAETHLKGRSVVEIVDLADVGLPWLDEPVPAAIGTYSQEHTQRWAETVAGFDGFVFVSPEYNHSMTAVLKNAIDFLFAEWNDKAAGLVTYGLTGGVRAAEHLRLVLAEVKVACVRSQVALSLFDDFDLPDITDTGTVRPTERQTQILARMLDDLQEWAGALRTLRNRQAS